MQFRFGEGKSFDMVHTVNESREELEPRSAWHSSVPCCFQESDIGSQICD